MTEAEPRRSVRATKGQHTKSFDEHIEQPNPPAPKKRQTKKSKKVQEEAEQEAETEPDELIRCVCGATEQDEDSGEAWIMCDQCNVWQHNVCMGVSSFEDEIPEQYWCEQCRPQDHKELLEGMEKNEQPWIARRKKHEEEEKEKKRKKGKKGSSAAKKASSEPKEEPKAVAPKEAAPTKNNKRKTREESHDTDSKASKSRRVSDNVSVSGRVAYTPPEDIAATFADLPGTRGTTAKAMKKSIVHSLEGLIKSGDVQLPSDTSADAAAEKYAIQIERAVYDTHPATKNQKEYAQQIKSLNFNLKNNPELCQGLVQGAHSPNTLAVMTSDQMASSEQQKQTAEMRAKAEKQSILYTQESGPRVRRTHKGEEFVEEDNTATTGEIPAPLPGGSNSKRVKKEPGTGDNPAMPRRVSEASVGVGGQQSPSNPKFDISEVFSSVKSPTIANRRPSAPQPTLNVADADVDRMLEDGTESPPYSPTDDTPSDPSIVWRGSLAMSTIADFAAQAKHIGGAEFSKISNDPVLAPKRLAVAGRIAQQSAIEYLCSLRYSSLTDLVVLSLRPERETAQEEFMKLIDYFISKQRYGVVGNKIKANVKDTYLVPVPAGDESVVPEFMFNLLDNHIPNTRTEPLLLLVIVWRSDPDELKTSESATTNAALGGFSGGIPGQRSDSISGPVFSPATPATGTQQHNKQQSSQTPVPVPQHRASQSSASPAPPSGSPPLTSSGQPYQPPIAGATAAASAAAIMSPADKQLAQKQGEALAKEILGPLITVATVQFLLPQAYQMTRKEWHIIKGIYEKEPTAQTDLQFLGQLLEKESAHQPR